MTNTKPVPHNVCLIYRASKNVKTAKILKNDEKRGSWEGEYSIVALMWARKSGRLYSLDKNEEKIPIR